MELVQDTEGFLKAEQINAATDPEVPPKNTLDKLLSVEELVGTQFSTDHRVETKKIQQLSVEETTRQVIAHRWRWKSGLEAVGVASSSSGKAFEQYVGAGLYACGLPLKHSLEVIDGATGKVVREVDLVGCHLGRLVCIDIKLPGADEHLKGTQLADIAEVAHSLGGQAALAIAVRPGWQKDDKLNRLAEALRVKLVTQSEAARIFSAIANLVDPRLTPAPSVLAAEQQLQAHQARGNAVLSDGSKVVATTAASGALHLLTQLEQMCTHQKRCWALVQLLGGQYYLGISKKSEFAPPQQAWPRLTLRLQEELIKISSTPDIVVNASDAWIYSQFSLKLGVSQAILQTKLEKLFYAARTTEG